MTVYGIGLGPGDADLLTLRGKRILETVDVVYSPGRLSRAVATAHVDADRIGDLEFPMTRDEETLKTAWREAANVIAPQAAAGDVAFVTLGDPNVYSTFGHLRRTLAAFHPDIEVTVVPGISAMTAFATALDVEVEAGAGLALREAANGAAPTGPDRMVLFKVTDAPTTARKLDAAGYDVTFGRRLFMETDETVVTDDPSTLTDRDYYTLAYAEHRDLEITSATDAFERGQGQTHTRERDQEPAAPLSDGGPRDTDSRDTDPRDSKSASTAELAAAEANGDHRGERR